jgi:hypothetical protein
VRTSDRARRKLNDVPMILKRLTLERKSPTGAYGDDFCDGLGLTEGVTAVKPSVPLPLVPFVAVPLLWPLASAPLQEAHMIAIECG